MSYQIGLISINSSLNLNPENQFLKVLLYFKKLMLIRLHFYKLCLAIYSFSWRSLTRKKLEKN